MHCEWKLTGLCSVPKLPKTCAQCRALQRPTGILMVAHSLRCTQELEAQTNLLLAAKSEHEECGARSRLSPHLLTDPLCEPVG